MKTEYDRWHRAEPKQEGTWSVWVSDDECVATWQMGLLLDEIETLRQKLEHTEHVHVSTQSYRNRISATVFRRREDELTPVDRISSSFLNTDSGLGETVAEEEIR